MSGPWPHPKTGILYYRKVTPPDIYAARSRLSELGVTVTREVQRSLGTRDRKFAERRYVEISHEVEALWDCWRLLLERGPVTLTHRQAVALAAERANAFVNAHEDNPFDAPVEPEVPHVMVDDESTRALLQGVPPEAQRDLRNYLTASLNTEGRGRLQAAFALLEKYPQLKGIVGADMAASLEKGFGPESDAALNAHGLNHLTSIRLAAACL